jgi:hypothetical protein
MPSFYNLPSAAQNGTVEQVNRFAQLPFYLVHNEVAQFARWNEFDQFFGTINWIDNMGTTMQGVTPQRSPVGRSFFFPNAITQVANKDIYQVSESDEQAIVYRHKFTSFQFNFLPSFQVFWDKYIQFADSDVVMQIASANNQFIETQMWQNAQNVYLCGTGLISGVPQGTMNQAYNAAGSKTAAWLQAIVQGPNGVQQNLRLRDIYNAIMILQDDLATPSFSGAKNMPKDNEGLKGKYVLMCGSEDFYNFSFDPDVINKWTGLVGCDFSVLFNDLKGMLFGQITCKIKRYPIRFNIADIVVGGVVMWPAGTPIDPEIFDVTTQKWLPNPYYTNLLSAPYSIAWLMGDSYIKTIKVGPPPKEFAAKNMSQQKFWSLQWNGEVRLTDQTLITNADGSIELNDYGENLQLKSSLVLGALMGERRFAFPMIIKRSRPAFQPVTITI